jgi:hypothetical protein
LRDERSFAVERRFAHVMGEWRLRLRLNQQAREQGEHNDGQQRSCESSRHNFSFSIGILGIP